MAMKDWKKSSQKPTKDRWTADDIINDLITEEDWTPTESEILYLDWRYFKNYGARYAGEKVDGIKYKNEREIIKKLLRWYYKKNKMKIVEKRGYIGTIAMPYEKKNIKSYTLNR